MTPLNQTSSVEWHAAPQVSQVRAIMRMLAILKNIGNFPLITVCTGNTTPNDFERFCATPHLGRHFEIASNMEVVPSAPKDGQQMKKTCRIGKLEI